MASEYFGINRGKLDNNPFANVAYGTSTQSTDIELRVDTGKGTTRQDIVRYLRSIEQFIVSGINPSTVPPL